VPVAYDARMVRMPLTEQDRARGLALGALLRQARGTRSVREVAAAAGLAEETVRKIERGGVPTPALFTVAALAGTLDLQLDQLVRLASGACTGATAASPAAVA
jgi:transcriptional regulator with XRE-family HTH domain